MFRPTSVKFVSSGGPVYCPRLFIYFFSYPAVALYLSALLFVLFYDHYNTCPCKRIRFCVSCSVSYDNICRRRRDVTRVFLYWFLIRFYTVFVRAWDVGTTYLFSRRGATTFVERLFRAGRPERDTSRPRRWRWVRTNRVNVF